MAADPLQRAHAATQLELATLRSEYFQLQLHSRRQEDELRGHAAKMDLAATKMAEAVRKASIDAQTALTSALKNAEHAATRNMAAAVTHAEVAAGALHQQVGFQLLDETLIFPPSSNHNPSPNHYP